jgi:hypothetical protein
LGKIGSIASQRSSGTRDWMFMISHHVTPLRFCNTLLAAGGDPRAE